LEKETDAKKRIPERDYLTAEDWRIIGETHAILKSLYTQIKYLEGRSSAANHGSIWEALPAMEFLLNHFEDLKSQYEHNDYMQLEDTEHD
jgi:hypothetical protein